MNHLFHISASSKYLLWTELTTAIDDNMITRITERHRKRRFFFLVSTNKTNYEEYQVIIDERQNKKEFRKKRNRRKYKGKKIAIVTSRTRESVCLFLSFRNFQSEMEEKSM